MARSIDDQLQISELRQTVESLSSQLSDMKDLLFTFSQCAEFRTDKPYLSALVRNMIGGEQRRTLEMVISIVLFRAQGQDLPHLDSRYVSQHPAIAEAYVSRPIDGEEAIRLIAMVVGSESVAQEILDAHRSSGMGAAGHEALAATCR
ncbi:hypothetical protein JS533_013415 [Bifidobacterium amazonense]|uniref:Uncharacterized protein n=1 Tax=Bifidobacterium amazonense TaxID=2809027 RepID=A0ABS9VZ87_9BIFI|nr:hypothetical protein [Bifidobacterium amazonense]MCH9277249.1 hypothetical protein [Bifidobacterium amazonense]